MTEEAQEGVTAEAEAPVATEQEQGAEAQVAAEEKKPSDQEINWAKANQVMKEQSQKIRDLEERVSRVQTPKEEKRPIFKGKDRDDIPTVGELEEAFDRYSSEQQQKIAVLEARAQYPDMVQVIEKYGKTLSENARAAILNAPNPYLAAYEMCKDSAAYYKDTFIATPHDDAKRVVENAKKPGNLSSVGSTGALSRASKYEAMDYSDIVAMSNKIVRGG